MQIIYKCHDDRFNVQVANGNIHGQWLSSGNERAHDVFYNLI